MANLSYTEITKEGREYRSELLVQKFMQVDGKENAFATEHGLFHVEYILLNDEKITLPKSKNSKSVDKITNQILSLSAFPKKKVVLGGKLAGKKKVEEIPLTKFEKTEEFGGATGSRINKGILFEHELEADLKAVLSGKKPKGKYAKQAKTIIADCSAFLKSPAKKIIPMGGLNQSRPIAVQGKQLYILPTSPAKHGEKLTDITIEHANKKQSFLSLKYSSTLTFMNAGVGRFLSEAQIKKGKITDPIGKVILETFGLDETMFCRVFNEYGKTKFKSVKKKITGSHANKLGKFLASAIGSGYWMVHGMDGGRIYFWNISDANNRKYSKVSTDIEIHYGGKDGAGKRIDISFSNNYYDFKVNIRNKQSGLYPSHIMCDYKSKPATGKVLLKG